MEKARRLSESSSSLVDERNNGKSKTKSFCVNTNDIPYLPDSPKQKSCEEEVRFNYLQYLCSTILKC